MLSCGSALHTAASGHVECVWVMLVMNMCGLSGVRIPARLMDTAGGRGDHDGSLAVLLEVLGLVSFIRLLVSLTPDLYKPYTSPA